MNHLAIAVSNQARSRHFYETYFGFSARPARVYDDGVVMLYDATGFELALGATAEPVPYPAWLHFGVGLGSREAVLALRDRLAGDGVQLVEERDEVDYVSVKCRDPDGHIVEAFWEPIRLDQTNDAPPFQLDERRRLRVLEETDANELHAVIEANRPFLSQWMPWPGNQTLAGTVDFIRSSRRQLSDGQGFQLAIDSGGQIVGVVGFHPVDWENRSTSR